VYQLNETGPLPNPALKKLSWLLGDWTVSGEAHGQVTFNWMEGGFFMVQHIDLIGTKGIAFIGYNSESEKLKAYYFGYNGRVLEGICEINESKQLISVDMQDINGTFYGKVNNGGRTINGRWRWLKDGKGLRCRVNLTIAE
jgi:hypothetical protein